MSKLTVAEIFHSIQGESSHMGRPCVFVRLTYCNLRCVWCDTEYAFEGGTEMRIDEIINVVKSYNSTLVEVTGGEPLLQEGVHELMTRLCDGGYEVLLETGGSIDVSSVDSRVKRIVDIKCPGSGMEAKNYWKNIDYLRQFDEIKFVIADREDYEWAKAAMSTYELERKCPVLMSVVFGMLEPIQLAEWILEDRLNVRFQLQMHKYIWSPEMRGV
ncbi:MAG: 7-carboxy-7-deazaguanine synthase QueE [Bacteroidota bacterium]